MIELQFNQFIYKDDNGICTLSHENFLKCNCKNGCYNCEIYKDYKDYWSNEP